MDEREIAEIIERVRGRVAASEASSRRPRPAGGGGAAAAESAGWATASTPASTTRWRPRAGPFRAFGDHGLAAARSIIAPIRRTMLENAELLAWMAHQETGLGRYEDKIQKNLLVINKTPGTEELVPRAVSGDARPDARGAGSLRRRRRHHPDHQPDLHHHQQHDRHGLGGERGRLQRAPQRAELLAPRPSS